MKIVHAVYSLQMGGAEVMVGQLSRIQREHGHQVTIVAYETLGAVADPLIAEGFDVRLLGKAPRYKTIWRYYELLRELQPDVVHAHNGAPMLQASPAAWLAGIRRMIVTRHSLEMPYRFLAEVQHSIVAWLACDWIAMITKTTRQAQLSAPMVPADKVVVVYNGVTPLQPTVKPGIERHGFTLVFVGRLAAIKDLGNLLHAVKLASERVPGLALWIVGDGAPEIRQGLERQADELGLQNVVRFWGMQMETAPYFSAADVFVMSSLSEGMPMSLLQAMSLGKPAIMTDVGGCREVLHFTGGGLLVPVRSPQAYADAIVRMAEDQEFREKCGSKARESYERYFTLDSMYQAYMRLYD